MPFSVYDCGVDNLDLIAIFGYRKYTVKSVNDEADRNPLETCHSGFLAKYINTCYDGKNTTSVSK